MVYSVHLFNWSLQVYNIVSDFDMKTEQLSKWLIVDNNVQKRTIGTIVQLPSQVPLVK